MKIRGGSTSSTGLVSQITLNDNGDVVIPTKPVKLCSEEYSSDGNDSGSDSGDDNSNDSGNKMFDNVFDSWKA